MKSNKDKALGALDEYLRGIYKLEKLFDPQQYKDENVMNARQMFSYLALEFQLKDNYTELKEYIKDTYGLTYSLRAIIYSANRFSDKVADSLSLQSQYQNAKEFLRGVYVKAR